jgi:hypothetical protein
MGLGVPFLCDSSTSTASGNAVAFGFAFPFAGLAKKPEGRPTLPLWRTTRACVASLGTNNKQLRRVPRLRCATGCLISPVRCGTGQRGLGFGGQRGLGFGRRSSCSCSCCCCRDSALSLKLLVRAAGNLNAESFVRFPDVTCIIIGT